MVFWHAIKVFREPEGKEGEIVFNNNYEAEIVRGECRNFWTLDAAGIKADSIVYR